MTTSPEATTAAPADTPRTNDAAKTARRVLAAVAAVESIVLLLAATGVVGAIAVLALHIAAIAAFAAWYWPRRTDPAIAAPGFLALILLAVAGPFGAIGALILPRLTSYRTEEPELLSAWYERIALSVETDALTKSSDHIAIGRSADLGAPPPVPFAELFATGSVAARQTALGMIARHFHPDYLAALKSALASPDAIVRVQAAAVAAKIKPQLEARVATGLAALDAASADSATTLAAAAELERCAASGLLPETDAARIRTAVAAAETRAGHAIDAARRSGKRSAFTPDQRALYENRLIAERRFAELRELRLARRDHFMRRYRWRPLATVAVAARGRAVSHPARSE